MEVTPVPPVPEEPTAPDPAQNSLGPLSLLRDIAISVIFAIRARRIAKMRSLSGLRKWQLLPVRTLEVPDSPVVRSRIFAGFSRGRALAISQSHISDAAMSSTTAIRGPSETICLGGGSSHFARSMELRRPDQRGAPLRRVRHRVLGLYRPLRPARL